ncbi:hypothetical protein ACLMJK_003682 [Lecanora helva]
MAKRKIIEDSDDDCDEISPTKQPTVDPAVISLSELAHTEDASTKDDARQSIGPSTGSTERLNQEIRAAHKSLIDPTPENTLPPQTHASSQNKSQGSPPRSRGKLKRATTSVEKPKAKRILKKYGTEARADIFDFHGDSDEDAKLGTKSERSQKQPASSWTDSSGDTIVLQPSDSLESHSKVGRRKQDMDRMLPPDFKSSMSAQRKSSDTEILPSVQDATTSSRFISSTPTSAEYDQSISSAYPNSSVPTNCSPSRLTAVGGNDAITNRTNRAELAIGEESIAVESAAHLPQTVTPVVLLPETSCRLEDHDELSFSSHGPETWSINQTSCLKAQEQKKAVAPQPLEPGSDDLAIGLPKDQYQPRPSRSRSGQGVEDVIIPTDFSKRPETMAKKKSKSAKKSKIRASDDFVPNGEGHEDREACHTELPETKSELAQVDAPRSPKMLPDGPSEKKDVSKAEQKSPPDPGPDPKKSGETKKQRGRPKKEATAKPPKEKCDAPCDADIAQNHVEVSATNHPKSGKKSGQAPQTLSKEIVHDSDDDFDDVDDAPSRNPQKGSDNNSIHSKSRKDEKDEEKEVPPLAPEKTTDPPQTPQKAEPPASKGLEKHSPISNGKVAYRVGLSKRARIAPLLSIKRKT